MYKHNTVKSELLTIFRQLPCLFMEKSRKVIGVAVPPCKDPTKTKELEQEIQELMKFGQCTDLRRGNFEILQHGIQMGPGSKVSSLCILYY